MWEKGKLTDLAKQRRNALSDAEGALLAFARTRETTEEDGIDLTQAGQDVEAALDKLEPESAERLQSLGSIARDEALRDSCWK